MNDVLAAYTTLRNWAAGRVPPVLLKDWENDEGRKWYLRKINAVLTVVCKNDKRKRLYLASNITGRNLVSTSHMSLAEAKAFKLSAYDNGGAYDLKFIDFLGNLLEKYEPQEE